MIDLLHTDCMEYMKGLEDNAFDLAIVDPPYFKGVAKSDFYGKSTSNTGVKRLCSDSTVWDANIPQVEYFNELRRVSLNQIIWGANYFNCFDDIGGSIVWDKKNDTSTFSNCEIASQSFSKGVFVFRHLWNGMCQEAGDKELRIHPTQKPVKLYEWLLSNYAKEGDRILDTHLGSGSSAIAAHYGGFDFVGCELDEDYYKAASVRFDRETAQIDIFQ